MSDFRTRERRVPCKFCRENTENYMLRIMSKKITRIAICKECYETCVASYKK